MSFETRARGRYFYSARRVDGRVVKEYLGSGPAAKQAAAEVAQRQRDRLDQRLRDLRFANQLCLLGEGFEQFWQASERALRLAFVASDFHCRKGDWRRRRGRRS